jgi:hypothetical protein
MAGEAGRSVRKRYCLISPTYRNRHMGMIREGHVPSIVVLGALLAPRPLGCMNPCVS